MTGFLFYIALVSNFHSTLEIEFACRRHGGTPMNLQMRWKPFSAKDTRVISHLEECALAPFGSAVHLGVIFLAAIAAVRVSA